MREFTPSMLTAIRQAVFYPALFYEGEFASGTLRLWTGVGNVIWNEQTWLGGGSLLRISPLSESMDLKAEGFEVSLSGMPSDKITLALSGMRQGKPGKLWLAGLTADGDMIADPYQLQEGRLDVGPIIDEGETCTITVKYEGLFIDLDRARGHRYTTEDLQRMSPDDLGFEYIPSLQDSALIWGGPGAAASSVASPAIPRNL